MCEVFPTGECVSWRHRHDRAQAAGEALYRRELVSRWLPALGGLVARLEQGARVGDIGCGAGYSTVTLAMAFPASIFHGFDPQATSVGEARENAALSGFEGRLRYDVADAAGYPGTGFDLLCFLHGLQDNDDRPRVAAHARAALAHGGRVLIALPTMASGFDAGLGRVDHRPARGQPAEAGILARALRGAGFSRVRTAARTPRRHILEARP